jgi:hypothetical protein
MPLAPGGDAGYAETTRAVGDAAPPEIGVAAAQLALMPEAGRWARDCAWLPGTGHCQNRVCDAACVFRPQRLEEGERLRVRRRLRRLPHRAFADRLTRD